MLSCQPSPSASHQIGLHRHLSPLLSKCHDLGTLTNRLYFHTPNIWEQMHACFLAELQRTAQLLSDYHQEQAQ